MGGCMTKGGHIKVMKTDGNVIRVEPPLYAKDIMCEYPNHGIFDAASVTRLGLVLARPLSFDAKLRPSRLYYLVPLPFNNNYNGNNMSNAMAKIQQLSSSLTPGEVSTMVEEDSDNEGAVRVKLRMRKEDAERFISECQGQSQEGGMGMDLDFVESVVTPLLTKEENTSQGSHGSTSCSSSTSSGWKPGLDTIDELNSDAESICSSSA